MATASSDSAESTQTQPATPNNDAIAATVPPMVELLRFLYLNNNKCSFDRLKPITLTNIQERLQCIVNMGQERPALPITIITKVYENKYTIRPDETLVALAFCARQDQNEELRRLAYSTAITLFKNQNDFLLFIRYCVDISLGLRGTNRKGFGNGLRKVITKWYAQYTPLQLANIFGEHRSLHGWTHRDLWKLAHIKPDTALQISPDAGTSTPITETDREIVSKFIFKDGQSYMQYLESASPLGGTLQEGALRMRELQIYKTNEHIENAIEQIRENGFKLNQSPAHLLHNVDIWDALLPSLTYRDLLENIFTLKDLGYLNEDVPFAKKYLDALSNLNNCTKMDPQICPIYVYLLKQLYDGNVRYLHRLKTEKYQRKVTKRKLLPNKTISRQLSLILEHTISTAKPVPAKYFVTIDLRKGNVKKYVKNNQHINCLDASVLLAFSILKREHDVQLYSFSDEKGKLLNLSGLPRMSFQMAKNYCTEKIYPKTQQDLKLPIKVAIDSRKKIDIFVVIVDSVARFSRDGKAPIQEFVEYKTKVNKGAKFVVINLARNEADLKYETNDDPKAFLEICGFDQNVPKLIHALARSCFL